MRALRFQKLFRVSVVALFLAFSALSLVASSEPVAHVCEDLFSVEPLTVHAFVAPTLRERFWLSPARSQVQRRLINAASTAFSKFGFFERRQWDKITSKMIDDLANPYSTTTDLQDAGFKLRSSAEGELTSLFRVLAIDQRANVSERPNKTFVSALNSWVRSETHALVLYDVLVARGLEHYNGVLAKLIQENLFFSESHLTRGPPDELLTYAFEKEGRSPEISNLYRAPNVPEIDWFHIPAVDRLETLKRLSSSRKTFLPASVIAPTDLRPSFLGGYSEERTLTTRQFQSWEIAHKRFEISPHRLMDEVKQITQLFGETHSLHVHTVFELPLDYDAHVPKFRQWLKSMNDALYIRGLEEGLHGSDLTNLMNMPEDLTSEPWLSKSVLHLDSFRTLSKLHTKFFSAGLRTGMYGEASRPNSIKLGIELRDTTRDVAKLGRALDEVSASVVDRVWEKDPRHLSRVFRLNTDRAKSIRDLISVGIRPEIATRFFEGEATASLPMQMMAASETPIYDYKTGATRAVPPELIARLETAKADYVKVLFQVQKEIDDFKIKNVKVEPEEIQIAIRQSLTEWAKAARASEVFTF